ncbi:MAG: hypothetical protein ACREE5_15530, partial [Acetobacteraceae bacterium]
MALHFKAERAGVARSGVGFAQIPARNASIAATSAGRPAGMKPAMTMRHYLPAVAAAMIAGAGTLRFSQGTGIPGQNAARSACNRACAMPTTAALKKRGSR